MIIFNDSGHRCLRHLYLEKVCKHMRCLFPKQIEHHVLLLRKQRPSVQDTGALIIL